MKTALLYFQYTPGLRKTEGLNAPGPKNVIVLAGRRGDSHFRVAKVRPEGYSSSRSQRPRAMMGK
jgi:hypothetical protein